MSEFVVGPSAKLQVERLDATEAAELERLLSQGPTSDTKLTDRGHFVSRLGVEKRVLWQWSGEGPAVVLSIVDHSYRVPA